MALRARILSATGQDVRRCIGCWSCEDLRAPEMDLTYGEVMRAAASGHPSALDNETIWVEADFAYASRCCQSGIDIGAVIRFLRAEATRQGIPPRRYGADTSSPHPALND